jgi:hypothetical protein
MSQDKEIMLSLRSFILSHGVAARLLKKKNGRIELAIIIDDDTSAEVLRKTWGKIDRLRTQLRELQGSDMQNLSNALMYRYSEMKANGCSYKDIANDINYDCLVHLTRAAEEIPDLNLPLIKSEGLSNAINLLKVMRMNDKYILEWLIPGLKEIHEGYAPWKMDSGPVDGQRVRDALRQWSQEQKSKKIVVKSPPKCCEDMSLETLVAANEKYWQKTEALLNNTDRDIPS